jgi:hypothetical protein
VSAAQRRALTDGRKQSRAGTAVGPYDGKFRLVAVLVAAACHAGWNVLIKVDLDPLSATTLIAIGAAVVGLIGLALAGLPRPLHGRGLSVQP